MSVLQGRPLKKVLSVRKWSDSVMTNLVARPPTRKNFRRGWGRA
jgi:hypothetical protein